MTIHTFMFRWTVEATDDEKARALDEIRGLQGKIPGLLEVWAGVNFSQRAQGYALGGVMKFADSKALTAYVEHPAHQRLVAWLMPLIEPLEVDFEA